MKTDVAGLQHAQAEELDQLERSVAGEDAVDGHPCHSASHSRSGWNPSDGPYWSIAAPFVLRAASRGVDHLVDRKGLVGGHSAREVDGLHRTFVLTWGLFQVSVLFERLAAPQAPVYPV